MDNQIHFSDGLDLFQRDDGQLRNRSYVLSLIKTEMSCLLSKEFKIGRRC